MIRTFLAPAMAVAFLAGPVAAQSIAFVQAPEQSSGIGFADTVEAAIADGVAQCVEGGALEEDCEVTTACEYGWWSIDVFAQHTEGPHWHESLCGLPDQATAEAVAAALCDRATRPYLMECALVQIWSPDGTPLMEQ